MVQSRKWVAQARLRYAGDRFNEYVCQVKEHMMIKAAQAIYGHNVNATIRWSDIMVDSNQEPASEFRPAVARLITLTITYVMIDE